MLTAGDLMTGDILSARADWLVSELSDFLAKNAISGAPVESDDGRLIGVVSLTDVARGAGHPAHATPKGRYADGPAYVSAAPRRGPATRSRATVRDIMTPMVFDVPVTATVAEIAQVMVRGRIHRVFVTEGGMVIGVVSALDVLKVLV